MEEVEDSCFKCESDAVEQCKECKTPFCNIHGDLESKLCEDCYKEREREKELERRKEEEDIELI